MNTDQCYLVAGFKTQIDFSPFLWKGHKSSEQTRHIPFAQVTVTISIYHSHPRQTCKGNQQN